MQLGSGDACAPLCSLVFTAFFRFIAYISPRQVRSETSSGCFMVYSAHLVSFAVVSCTAGRCAIPRWSTHLSGNAFVGAASCAAALRRFTRAGLQFVMFAGFVITRSNIRDYLREFYVRVSIVHLCQNFILNLGSVVSLHTAAIARVHNYRDCLRSRLAWRSSSPSHCSG